MTRYAFVLAALLGGFTHAQTPILFQNVDLFDGQKRTTGINVLIAEGLIQEIGPNVKASPKAKVIDGTGKTLVPGLIDCHTHAFFETHLQQAAFFGVTTELDMMSNVLTASSLRVGRANPLAEMDRADFYSAGAAVTVPGGHGTQFGFAVPTLKKAADTKTFVRSRVREGSDYIKIIIEDGSAFGFSRPTVSAEMIRKAVAMSKELEKLAVAHVSTQDSARIATEAGVSGLVHLFCESEASEELVDTVRESGMFVVPTMAVIANSSDSNSTDWIREDASLEPLLTTANITNLTTSFPKMPGNRNSNERLRRNVKRLYDAGVPILAGTDSPNPGTVHGASMHHELRLLVDAGLTPIDALRAATSLPAKAFGLSDRGSIRPKLRADLLLIDGDPTRKIETLARIVGVWKNGREIQRTSRLEAVQREQNAGTTESGEWISSFESGRVDSKFGAGWMASTDAMMGGKSTAAMKVIDGGARESSKSLQISGTTQTGNPAFSGAMFSPGAAPMQPAKIGEGRTLSFWAKGDDTEFRVMLFFQKRGFAPSTKSFTAGKEWRRYRFVVKEFDGCDGSDVLGIWFGADRPGKFEFQIDEVRLLRDQG
ncbi:MAG: amidohydrolase family protein [Planctomycetota bacterium]